MTGAAFVKLLKTVTYKPEWRLHAEVMDYRRGGVVVVLTHTEVDAANHDVTTQIMQRRIIPWQDVEDWGRDNVIEWLRQLYMDAEEHEFKEFFRVDGVAPFPAH